MATFVVRVWVPDRPGALGAVGSRIGAVRGDLVGIEILERGGGRAIDELVVSLPDVDLVPLLIEEISEVDGVAVEDVRPAPAAVVDARLAALETAAFLVERTSVGSLLASLTEQIADDFMAEWSCVLRPGDSCTVQAVGDVPAGEWLTAFVSGVRLTSPPSATGAVEGGPEDVAWADLSAADLIVLLGRRGRPFRSRERRQLAALARIVDQRWQDLTLRSGARVIRG